MLLSGRSGLRIFFPLCGKAVDMKRYETARVTTAKISVMYGGREGGRGGIPSPTTAGGRLEACSVSFAGTWFSGVNGMAEE